MEEVQEIVGNNSCLFQKVPEIDPLLRTSLFTAENQISGLNVKMCNETAVVYDRGHGDPQVFYAH